MSESELLTPFTLDADTYDSLPPERVLYAETKRGIDTVTAEGTAEGLDVLQCMYDQICRIHAANAADELEPPLPTILRYQIDAIRACRRPESPSAFQSRIAMFMLQAVANHGAEEVS